MEAPRIQYARTSDGFRIAYIDAGAGHPLVMVPSPPISNVRLQWRTFDYIHHVLAGSLRHLAYDPRGCGLSQRPATDFSIEAMMRDFEAVVEKAGLTKVALWGNGDAIPVCVAIAARWPERISHLVAVEGWTSYAEVEETPWARAWAALSKLDWDVFVESAGPMWLGNNEEGRKFGGLLRDCCDAETYRLAATATQEYDVGQLLPSVAAPALVIHRSNSRAVPAHLGPELAARFPKGEFLMLDDASFHGFAEAVIDFITASAPGSQPEAAFRTILFTDLVGHTEMMSRLGDTEGRDALREHERITRQCLKEHAGAEIKTMGDGFLASFGSAQHALECAIALQKALTPTPTPGSSLAGEGGLRVRIGVNAGEPIAEADDLFGASVIVASRIAARAEGGQVLVADVVRQLVAGKGFLFSDTGEHVLKGLEDPVRVWELRWEPPG